MSEFSTDASDPDESARGFELFLHRLVSVHTAQAHRLYLLAQLKHPIDSSMLFRRESCLRLVRMLPQLMSPVSLAGATAPLLVITGLLSIGLGPAARQPH